MSEHSAHLTSLSELVYPRLWWYTYFLFDFDSALAQESELESKGDMLSSSVKCRVRTLEVRDTRSSADWMPKAFSDSPVISKTTDT